MDILIYGCGTLGTNIAQILLQQGHQITALTGTEKNHPRLKKIGIKATTTISLDQQFDGLIFSLPPSKVEDYSKTAKDALTFLKPNGKAIMTSSTAVYAEQNGGRTTEESPLAHSERAHRLLNAEQHFYDARQHVVRLSGLYNAEKGPQNVFVKNTKLDRNPDGLLNLIHYDDAATFVVQVLKKQPDLKTLIATDGSPITRESLAQIAFATLENDLQEPCKFNGKKNTGAGRILDNSLSRSHLDWSPTWTSITEWLLG
ncbi:MAG: hypothetical protein MK193_14385 [Lentisphaeria bacterium]|nr:hypothetical protein [Lentisphaeria bacterium]